MKLLLILLLAAPASATLTMGSSSGSGSGEVSTTTLTGIVQPPQGGTGQTSLLGAWNALHQAATGTFLTNVTIVGSSLTVGGNAGISGNLGIGTALPASRIHISSGPSGAGTALLIDGNSVNPIRIINAQGISSMTINNVAATGKGVEMVLGVLGGALTPALGYTVALGDTYDGSRPEGWFRLAWSDTLEKFGMWRKFDGNRILNISAGGSALADNCTLTSSGNIGLWTGSAAAVKHLFSGCGRFGLNVGYVNPEATFQAVAKAADDWLVDISSQNVTTKIFRVGADGFTYPMSYTTLQLAPAGAAPAPRAVGGTVYNSTINDVCVSTGTSAGNWAKAGSSGATGCF